MEDQAREDLALVRRFMEETRREVVDRGTHLLIWGVISTVGLGMTWTIVGGMVDLDPRWMWAGLLAAGWLASIGVGRREGRGARVRTVGRRLLSAVWVATGVSLTLIGIAGLFAGVVDVRALPGLLAIVVATAFMVTSLLIGERWLAWIAAGWWLGGGAMLVWSGPRALLAMAAMAAAGMALPGAVLFLRARREPSSAPHTDPA